MRNGSGELSVGNIWRGLSGICGEMSQEMSWVYPGNCRLLVYVDYGHKAWRVDCPSN